MGWNQPPASDSNISPMCSGPLAHRDAPTISANWFSINTVPAKSRPPPNSRPLACSSPPNRILRSLNPAAWSSWKTIRLIGAQEQQIEFNYELLGRNAYSSSNQRIDNAIFGIDPSTPLSLFEARNAVRIARAANADQYAGPVITKAAHSLQEAETAYRNKNSKPTIEAFAREAAQDAEDARVMALKKQEEERLAKDAFDREAAAKVKAEAEAQRARQAEQDRARAEAALAEAEKMKQEAQLAAQQAAEAKAEAQRAQAAAVAQQQVLAAEADKSRQAAQEADRLRQQADKEKTDLRARLLQQLNLVLETHDSARGLISNMGDVLFETGKYELKPEARERLAKVSGILLAYPTLKVAIEGHTDSVGSDDYNQRLSEQRAEAVRDYFVQQAVSTDAVSAHGLEKLNLSPLTILSEGRQRNRRVELVLSGDAIGATASSNASASQRRPVIESSRCGS